MGNQTLSYDVIANEAAIRFANDRAVAAIKAGAGCYFDRVQKGGWENDDFETSLGAVGISYKVAD